MACSFQPFVHFCLVLEHWLLTLFQNFFYNSGKLSGDSFTKKMGKFIWHRFSQSGNSITRVIFFIFMSVTSLICVICGLFLWFCVMISDGWEWVPGGAALQQTPRPVQRGHGPLQPPAAQQYLQLSDITQPLTPLPLQRPGRLPSLGGQRHGVVVFVRQFPEDALRSRKSWWAGAGEGSEYLWLSTVETIPWQGPHLAAR